MQHLQIKYEESSPHVQYLLTHSLLDQQDVHEHQDHDPLQHMQYQQQTFQFQQTTKEQQGHPLMQSYQEYIEGFTRILFPLGKSQWVKRGANVLLGHVFSYAYHLNWRGRAIFSQFKWILLLKALTLFLILLYLPLQLHLLLLFALTTLIYNEEETLLSQYEKAASFKNDFGAFSFQLKAKYHQINSNNARTIFTNTLHQFMSYLQSKYCFSVESSNFILDQIDISIHLLNSHIKRSNYSQRFMNSKWTVLRMYYFWRLKVQNRQLTHLVQAMKSILEENTQRKEVKYLKPKKDQNIYYLILLGKLERELTLVDKGVSLQSLTSLLQILKKEVQLKEIFSLTRKHLQEQVSEEKEQMIYCQEECKGQVEPRRGRKEDLEYLQDNSPIPYEPEHIQAIKQKLDALLQRKLEKEQQAGKLAKMPEPSVLPQQKGQRSIFSFGIPLAPPKRDMDAYYIE